MDKKCIVIYNPNSGKGTIKKKINYIKTRLEEKYGQVDIYETKSQQDLIDKAASSCDIYDAIIFSGGDGAFNNIIRGIMKKEKRPPLGYIPAGTVCDIARNLGSSKKINKALDVILNGIIIPYDVGKVNDNYFVYTNSTGTFVSTSYMTSSKKKNKFGKLAYYLGGIKEFFKPTIKRVEFKQNNRIVKIKTPLLLILNSRSIGGFPINKNGKINSGKFDIYIVKNSNNKISGAINVIRFMLRGFIGMSLLKVAYHLRETKFEINGDLDMQWTVDGEEGPRGKVEVEYLENQFYVYASPKKIKYFTIKK